MKTIKFLSLLILSVITFTSCSSDDDNPRRVNQEEVITTLTAMLTPQGGGTTVTMQFQDLDGDGPNAPTMTVSGPLDVNTTYNGSLDLLNETETPAESITDEIEEEDDEHQFFFSSSLGDFTYTDSDGDGNPVGLSFSMTTSSTPNSGGIAITLRHEPNKDAEGVSEGDITNAGGETDIFVIFNVDIE